MTSEGSPMPLFQIREAVVLGMLSQEGGLAAALD